MTFLTFFNERSYLAGHLSQGEARQVARALISVLRELKDERADLALHSSEPLANVPLGESLWLGSLRADGETRDEWRFLRGLENRAPFHIGLNLVDHGLVEYQFEGREAAGLGLAHNFDALSISFDRDPWRQVAVEIDRIELNDDGVFDCERVTVRNAALRSHIHDLRRWVRLVPLEEPADGNEMWEQRANRFPRLRFLSQVEAQLRSLKSGTPELLVVNRRLWEIQTAAAEWDVASEPLPRFRSKVAPEHEQRRQMFELAEIGGETRCFDLHARYTPGAGRIHLWCDRSTALVFVGYVGDKIQ